MACVTELPTLPIPRLIRVRQQLPSHHVADVVSTVRAELDRTGLRDRLRPGHRVAITAGSRGIADIAMVIQTVVAYVKDLGAEPFVVPAMGSHGGATPEGQRHLLAEYGITEASVGAPIRATMDTVTLGTIASGATVYFDAEAAEADATIVVNRVKAHTAFRGPIESGLCKMAAVGLGKQRGAEQLHARGLREGIPAAASLTLAKANIVAGVALVENGEHQLAVIRGARPDEFQTVDADLLRVSNDYLPRVPFGHLHVLVVAWMGKNISGSGMDFNVVGMWRRIGGEQIPNFERIVVLDLTEESGGNGLGMGIADLATRRLYEKVDLGKTYMNGLTANALSAIKIPVILNDDREAIAVALHSVGHGVDARLAVIRSTLHLDELWVSESLLPEVRANPRLRVVGEATDAPFDADGRLTLFDTQRYVMSV